MKYFGLFSLMFFLACNNGQQQPAAEKKVEEAEKIFLPVSDLVREQLREVDSLRLPLVGHLTKNGKTEVYTVSAQEFHQLAEEFLHPDINDPSIKDNYKESSFADQSIPNVTFTYSTNNSAMELQRVDVILIPDVKNNERLKSIYMEKSAIAGDSLIQKKLFWRAGKNFQIISSSQKGAGPVIVERRKIAWDPTE